MSQKPEAVTGKVLDDQIIQPRGYYGREIMKGEVLRIIDLEGQQVADFVCFNLHRLEERISPENTINLNGQVYPGVGYVLISDEASKLMTIIEDTCGVHDMLAGACSSYTNEYRYGIKGTLNCRDNLAAAVEPWGLKWKDVPYNMNVFMNCPIESDGSYSIQPPKSKAGDYIDFRAEMDVLAALSNCPQEHNPCNAGELKPLRVIHYRPDPIL